MRTCKNCVFRKVKTLDCALYGTCSYQVSDPANEHCSDHQYPEKMIQPVLDEAVSLLDSFLIALSNTYERRAKKLIGKYDELYQEKAKGYPR